MGRPLEGQGLTRGRVFCCWSAETDNTPDHLASEGFAYACDWVCDDQPIPMRVKSGRMVAMPYPQRVNDIVIYVQPTAYRARPAIKGPRVTTQARNGKIPIKARAAARP